MLGRSVIAVAILSLGTSPVWAQSTVDRANARDERGIDYRNAHCAPGNEAACARANANNTASIDYRNAHATDAQRDPNDALARANARDARSIEYRNANCAPGNQAACARANAKTERAIANRDAQTPDPKP